MVGLNQLLLIFDLRDRQRHRETNLSLHFIHFKAFLNFYWDIFLHLSLIYKCIVSFFLKISFIYFLDRGRRKRGRVTSMCGCLSHTFHWGPGPQPRHVPWLGIKPATLQFADPYSTQWAIPARVYCLIFMHVFSSHPFYSMECLYEFDHLKFEIISYD